MNGLKPSIPVVVFGLILASASSPANAARCGGAAGFKPWLAKFEKQAIKQGISASTARALRGLAYDAKVIRLDRSQRGFKASFQRYCRRRLNNAMIRIGQRKIKAYARMLRGIEKRFGVPGPVLVSIWGLETGYGGFSGNMNVLRSLATLAYDCRRKEMFTRELIAALKILDRGDMRIDQMRGAWAGEIGQTQFLASNYVRFAVDWDRDGRRDLIRSVPDVLASTANYLKGYGWKKNGGWKLGSHNFKVIEKWNRARVYQLTISRMSTALANPGNMSIAEICR